MPHTPRSNLLELRWLKRPEGLRVALAMTGMG
jgi:hypothetical protein